MHAETEEIASFGLFRLFPARRSLERAGERIRLSDRAFDILVTLIAHAPEIVSKSTLLAQAWPDVTVEEGSLRLQMNALRRALDDGDDNRYIATFHGRGYCFLGAVVRTAGQTPGPRTEAAPEPTATPELAAAPQTNLSQPLDRLIGRAQELAELQTLLQQHRLVTIVGTGGIGKTRLATELGLASFPQFPGGVRLVDLAPVSDPAIVLSATASVVGAQLHNPERGADAVASAIGRERQLLIFDNCEYVVEAAAALIAGLLGRLPNLSIVATSQEALHIPAEQVYRLPPLALPAGDATDIARFGAISLFVERVRALDHRFELTEINAASVAEICRSLDGLPLALEMAAGRVPLLGISGLQSGLGDRLRMLTASPAAAGTRRSTLRATVDWSYGLLDATEQQIFRRIGIFTASFSLAAMLAVVEGADRWTIVDAFGRLVDKSLVMIEAGEPPRYRLLETLRLFAADKLQASGEKDIVSERHARHVVEALQRAQLAWETEPDAEWTALYSPEIDNLRMALDWSSAMPDRRQIAIALGGPGLHLFDVLDLLGEKRQRYESLVPLIDADTPPSAEAALLRHTSYHWESSVLRTPIAYVERAVTLCRTIGDKRQLASALGLLGILLSRMGRLSEAEAAIDEAWALVANSAIDKTRLTLALHSAIVMEAKGEFAKARDYHLRALDMARAVKSSHEVWFLSGLSITEYLDGNLPAAIQWGRDALDCARRAPAQQRLVYVLMNMVAYLLADDQTDEARLLAAEALPRIIDLGIANCVFLQIYAVLAAYEGRLEDAAQLIGFVDAERIRTGFGINLAEHRLYDELGRRLERGLPAERRAALRDDGGRWARGDALTFIQSRWFA